MTAPAFEALPRNRLTQSFTLGLIAGETAAAAPLRA
jgi:hypothetical protein